MSLLLQSLRALSVEQQAPGSGMVTLISAGGMVNVPWSNMAAAISSPLADRIDALEDIVTGGQGGSYWPMERSITLTGAVTGTVAMDGRTNVTMVTNIADGSLSQAKVLGLTTKLDELTANTSGAWRTGYTGGAQPTTTNADLNSLTGATFLHIQGTAANRPTGVPGELTMLTVGPTNSTNQLGLSGGEMWMRGQVLGAYGLWNKVWHSGNLDPTTLLLKTDVAMSATKLATARSFLVSGVVSSGVVNFDGTGNAVFATTMADGALTIAKTTGLSTALGLRAEYKGDVGTTILNSVSASGIYWQPTPASATIAANYPMEGITGQLTVVNTGTVIYQSFKSSQGRMWERVYQDSAWSGWSQVWTSSQFNPATKFDKAGGTISGNTWITGSLSAYQLNGTIATIDQVQPTTTGSWGFLMYDSTKTTSKDSGGIWNGVGEVEFVNARNGGWHSLSITDDGILRFKTQTVFHTGNFDPAAPVPAAGLLSIGNPASTNLKFRYDGRYSVDGGTTWRVINEAPAVNLDPEFNTLKVGPSKNIYLYTDTGDADTLQVRTGSAAAGWKWFQFKDNGNFHVPNGRVLIAGYEAWHAGNFDPATKLGATATAAAATKLATARTINGVAFDGTSSITIPTAIQTSSITDLTVRVPTGMYETAPELTLVEKGFPAGVVGGWAFTESITHSNATNNYATQRVTSFNDIGHSYIRAVSNNGVGPWYRQWNSVNLPNPMSRNGGDMIGALMSYQNGYFTPAIDAPLITKSFDPFTSGRYNGIGRWGMFMEAGRIGFGVPQGANGPKVFEYVADGTIAREHLIYTSGNLAPFDVNNGGTVRNIVHFKYGAPNTQKTFHTFGWNNEINRFAHVMEGGGEFVLYSYDVNGSTPRQACIWRSYDVTDAAGKYRTLDNFGGVRTSGPHAAFVIEERTDPSIEWHHYSMNGQFRIWNKQTNADRFTINPDGYANFSGRLSASGVFSGWDSGVAGAISCSNWFRTTGQTGIFFADYGGGVFMQDSQFVRTYNGKEFAAAAFQNTGGSPSPNVVVNGCAFRAIGNWGGGFGVIDATVAGAFYGGGGQLKIAIANSGGEGYLYGLTYGKDGVLTANDYALYSDRRLKKNIKPLEFRGPLVPVEHEWIEGKGEAGVHLGFIAQTMRKLYPELVRNVSEGELTVIYPKVTAVLAAQNNLQQKQIDKQQKTINAQDKSLKALKKQVALQQKQIAKILKNFKAA